MPIINVIGCGWNQCRPACQCNESALQSVRCCGFWAQVILAAKRQDCSSLWQDIPMSASISLTQCFLSPNVIWWNQKKKAQDVFSDFTLNTWNSLLLFKAVPYSLEMSRQLSFATRIHRLASLCPWHILYFLFRAFKDFQGCQESQERGAQGWVSPNQWQVSQFTSLFFFFFFHYHFSFLLQNLLKCLSPYLNDALIMSWSALYRDYTIISTLICTTSAAFWSSTQWHLWITAHYSARR